MQSSDCASRLRFSQSEKHFARVRPTDFENEYEKYKGKEIKLKWKPKNKQNCCLRNTDTIKFLTFKTWCEVVNIDKNN